MKISKDLANVVERFYVFEYDNSLLFEMQSANNNTAIYKVYLSDNNKNQLLRVPVVYHDYLTSSDMLWFNLSMMFAASIYEKNITIHIDKITDEYYAVITMNISSRIIDDTLSELSADKSVLKLYSVVVPSAIRTNMDIHNYDELLVHYVGNAFYASGAMILYNSIQYSLPTERIPLTKSIYTDLVSNSFKLLKGCMTLSQRLVVEYTSIYYQSEIRINASDDESTSSYILESLSNIKLIDDIAIDNITLNSISISNNKKWRKSTGVNVRYLTEFLGAVYSHPDKVIFALDKITNIKKDVNDIDFSVLSFTSDIFVLEDCVQIAAFKECRLLSIPKLFKSKLLLVIPYNDTDDINGFDSSMMEEFLKNNKKYRKKKFCFIGSSEKYSYIKLF